MKVKKALITAAGFGSRFLPITKTFPKEMLPVVNKPIIHWVVKECAEGGIEEIIIVASPDEVKTYEDYFYGHAENIHQLMVEQGKLERWKKVEEIFKLPKITVIPEDRKLPYGNGRPILTAKSLLKDEEAFLTCWGDDLFLYDISPVKQITEFYENNVCDGVLGVIEAPVEMLIQGGAIKVKSETLNQVETVQEKLTKEQIENDPKFTNLYSLGRYILTPRIFDFLKPTATGRDGELWLQDANDQVAKHGKMFFCKLEGRYYTTGDPESYLKAQMAFGEKYL